MTSHSEFDRKRLRRSIARAVLSIQGTLRSEGQRIDVVLPEIVAALLSCGCHIAKNNLNLDEQDMREALEATIREQWPPTVIEQWPRI